MSDELDGWRQALAADNSVQGLLTLVRHRLAAGDAREQVIEQLTRLILEMRREQRPERDEDPILDVLDMLTGWGAPGSAL